MKNSIEAPTKKIHFEIFNSNDVLMTVKAGAHQYTWQGQKLDDGRCVFYSTEFTAALLSAIIKVIEAGGMTLAFHYGLPMAKIDTKDCIEATSIAAGVLAVEARVLRHPIAAYSGNTLHFYLENLTDTCQMMRGIYNV